MGINKVLSSIDNRKSHVNTISNERWMVTITSAPVNRGRTIVVVDGTKPSTPRAARLLTLASTYDSFHGSSRIITAVRLHKLPKFRNGGGR